MEDAPGRGGTWPRTDEDDRKKKAHFMRSGRLIIGRATSANNAELRRTFSVMLCHSVMQLPIRLASTMEATLTGFEPVLPP
jgi:hypothetical protein